MAGEAVVPMSTRTESLYSQRFGDLDASYEACRALHRQHGRTYYLATRLLPGWKRRHVHALYGFTRHTDNLVDDAESCAAERETALREWTGQVTAAFAGGPVDDPVLPALLHTVAVFGLDPADFAAFLRSMTMDLTVGSYETYGDLLEYMEGSAAAIGSMMLPILGAWDPAQAREPARQLGLAFQLTNFIRDVGEDLDRGRVYLPLEDLARFGVTRTCLRRRTATDEVRALIAFEVQRARRHYLLAAPGIAMLDVSAQPCIRTAFRLYGAILDEVVRADHDVFERRATVSRRRRLAVVATSLLTPPGAR